MARRTWYRVLSLAIFVVEVLIATVWAHLGFVRSSLGDVLVVMLLYCLALSLREFRRGALAGVVFVFACAVEVSQYFHLASVLHFKPNSVGWIILGSSFQWTDILCYLTGCAVALFADVVTLPRSTR